MPTPRTYGSTFTRGWVRWIWKTRSGGRSNSFGGTLSRTDSTPGDGRPTGLARYNKLAPVLDIDVDELWVREQFLSFVRNALDLD